MSDDIDGIEQPEPRLDRLAESRIVPAQPGWHIACIVDRDDEDHGRPVEFHPIIAWRINLFLSDHDIYDRPHATSAKAIWIDTNYLYMSEALHEEDSVPSNVHPVRYFKPGEPVGGLAQEEMVLNMYEIQKEG